MAKNGGEFCFKKKSSYDKPPELGAVPQFRTWCQILHKTEVFTKPDNKAGEEEIRD